VKRFSMVTVRKRVVGLFFCFVLLFGILTFRLLYLEVIRNDYFTTLALEQRLRPIPILANRGDILDRNMNKLAVSMSADAVYAIPAEITDMEQTASVLAAMLDLDAEWVKERLGRKQSMVWLKLKIDPDTAREVLQANLKGIGVTDRPQRFYPNGPLAAQVLGFAGIDNQGLEGIEAYYDRYLRGNPGMLLQERDAGGRAIPGGIESRLQPQDGYDLVLTIDQAIQYAAESELERAVLETQSEFGIMVLVQPKTGEVLASAVYPSFDPNSYNEYPSGLWRNRAVTDQFEPGSTFKVVTGSAALDAGVTRLDEVFVDPVRLVRWGGRVSCWRPQGHGEETFIEAVENSCNPIFAILGADRLGPQRFYEYVSAFGFGKKTGIDFPGEAVGQVPKPGKTKHGELLQWANIGFGQGIAVTPIQLAMMAAAIANDGKLMQPYLVKEVRDKQGNIIEETTPKLVRQVVSEKTARDFAMVMRSVVVNGSGANAAIAGYAVAGKTGTAEMPSPQGGYSEDRMASFLGFAPVEDPQIAGVIMLVRIGVRPAYGGTWAAPVFARVVEKALKYLQVPRQADPETLAQPSAGSVFVPNVKNLDVETARAVLTQASLKVELDKPGTIVETQMPQPGTEVKKGSTVYLGIYQEDETGEEVVVPKVIGLSLRDASVTLGQSGLRIRIVGTGVAVEQTPPPGTTMKKEEVVVVRFASGQLELP
jgi:stage V sporulation protein D (sporulation-specific penicillin-binding protein)